MRRFVLMSGTAILAAQFAGSAYAQQADAQATSQERTPTVVATGVLEEVIVTAERTSSNLQKVPVSVSAFTAADLEASHLYNAQALQTKVPALFYGKFGGTNAQVSLRGVGNLNQSIGGEQGVAFVRDGVVLGRPGAAANQFYDIERVEVLRGPQGTLYGRNTTGGVVSVITEKPKLDEYGGFGDILLGSYMRTRLRGAVNLPLSETVAARVAILSDTRDGYGKNLLTGQDLDDDNYRSARAHLLYAPRADLEFLLTGEMFRQKTGGTRVTYGIPQPGVTPVPQPFPANKRDNYRDFPEFQNNYGHNLAGTVKWMGDSINFTSTTGYVKTLFDAQVDYDGSEVDWAAIRRRDHGKQFSQEFQFSSVPSDTSRFNWVAGIFLFHENVYTAAPFFTISPTVTITADGRVKSTSIAAYGQGTYKVTDKLGLTVGLRYTYDKKKAFEYNLTQVAGVSTAVRQDYKNSWPSLTPKFGIDYQITDDILAYASVTKGFQSGGYNISAQQGRSYDPEYLWAYEAGLKSRFADNRIQLNLAGYYYSYKDIITQNRLPGFALTYLENAASAQVRGLEFEAIALPTENTRIDLSVGYVDAEYKKYSTQDPDRGFALFNLKGNQLPFAPKWNVSVSAEATQPTDFGNFTLRGEYRYQTAVYFTAFNVPIAGQKAYGQTNARLMFTPAKGSWDAEVFIENIEDNLVRTNVLVQRGQQHATTWYTDPRTIGVRLGYKF